MTDIKVGDEVRVFPGRRHSRTPEGGYPAVVTRTGHKYATATYTVTYESLGEQRQSEQAVEFDMATGYERGSVGNYADRVMSPAMVEADLRQRAARAVLRDAGFEVRLGYHPPAELILAVAAAIETFGQED